MKVANVIAQGARLGKVYLQKGVIKFEDWADAMLEHMGDSVKDYLKRIYNQVAGDDELPIDLIEQMDSRRAVHEFDLDSFYDEELSVEDELFESFKEQLQGEGFKDNAALKALVAEVNEIKVSEVTQEQLKEAQELLESAVTELLADIPLKTEAGFKQAVELYKKLPLLNVKSSKSATNQAYSTPAPLAWLANSFADVQGGDTSLDNSSGNGALLAFSDKARPRPMILTRTGLSVWNGWG